MQYLTIDHRNTTLAGLLREPEVVIFADTAFAFTLTLPMAIALNLYNLTIKVIGANSLTIVPFGVETIDAETSIVMAKYDYIQIVSDNKNLYIVNRS
jgi:virulence-associated protein VagC